LVISFDPFDVGPRETALESRGLGVALLVSASLVLAVALAPMLVLLAISAGQLAPMWVDVLYLHRLATGQQFVLQAAAAALGRPVLATFAAAQTWLALGAIATLSVYFLLRGFSSRQVRGWSDWFWMAGVVLVFFAPTVAPDLTLERVDYLATFPVGLEGRNVVETARRIPRFQNLFPDAVMTARAILATGAGWFAALCMHDIGYRLREALIDFGLVDDEKTDERRFESFGRGAAGASRRAESDSAKAESGQGFGHRDTDRTSFDNPRARAYATLGVAIGASRDEIERAYRTRMKTAHPDHGGSVERAATLNQARDLLLPRA
jgi:hypothetical protein